MNAGGATEDDRSKERATRDAEAEALFGAAKRPASDTRAPAAAAGGPVRHADGRAAQPARADGPPVAGDPVVKRWFKRLPNADAQQLVGSSPSNTMTLVEGVTVDRNTYFRYVFFASET